MNEPKDNQPQTAPTPRFPWMHVLFTALAVLTLVGLIILIRKGGGVALAAAAPAVALGVVRAHRTKESAGVQHKETIDMDFLKAQLRQGASEKVVATPTELKIVLTRIFEKHNLPPPFESEQQMAKILAPLGLHSKVRSMPGRSERRWYDLAGMEIHETPAQ
jgi:hypothetical protein